MIKKTNINHMVIKIYLPKQPYPVPLYRHTNDTFRELIKLWAEAGLCQIIETNNPHIWWNEIGDVLLYDHPTLEQLYRGLSASACDTRVLPPTTMSSGDTFRLALLGNPSKPTNDKFAYWIFWARRPRILEEFRLASHYLDYNQRKYNTIFIGKIENQIQARYRSLDWAQHVDLFEMAKPNQPHKYDQLEYLKLLANSRFGLCLRGYGPKCNREIELLALGTVLLVTPEVDTENYYKPLIEGTHYFKVNHPSDIPTIIRNCSPEKWIEMSHACRQWYLENASPEGSFKTTREIIQTET